MNMAAKALLLLSSGIDSPVAGYIMQQRGLDLIAVHFHYIPLSNNETIEKSKRICEILGIKKLIIIPFAEVQKEVISKCYDRYFYVITRRMMYRIAELIAKQENCEYLVTGENLGQVSSQTLDNMCIIDKALTLPVLRPLLGNDKVETIRIAEKIGTFEISKGPEICCLLGPKHPVTRGKLGVAEEEEKNIEADRIIRETAGKAEAVDILVQNNNI